MTELNSVLILEEGEHIITAWASPASGPGWSNFPIQVLIRNSITNKLRIHYIQPDKQTVGMLTLYGVSAAACGGLTREVQLASSTKKHRA